MSDSALFGALNTGPVVSELPLEDVRPDPGQPRKVFNQDQLKELASSLDQVGQVQPIVVRTDPEKPGGYIITAGERRYRALQLLKKPTVLAIVRSDENAAVVAIVENLQRVDLKPVEEAEAVARLLEDKDINQTKATKLIGKGRGIINQLVQIAKLPAAIRAEANDTDVPKSIFVELSALKDEDTQLRLWKRAKAGNLTVAELRKAKKAESEPAAAAESAEGVRRLTPAGKALQTISKAVTALQAQELTDEERQDTLELINRLNALTVLAGEVPQ